MSTPPSNDNVKVRCQVTRHVRTQSSVTCQIDRNAAIILAPPRVVPLAFDTAHEAISRVHYAEECALFDAVAPTLRQFQVGINTAVFFMGHTAFRQAPHDILDGLLTKMFRQVVNGAKSNVMHHQVMLRAQFVACVPPRQKYLDLLRDGAAPNPQPQDAVDPAVGDGWCGYAPINAFDPCFNGGVQQVHTPEDALNLYVMGLHRLRDFCANDRSRNSDTAVEDTATIFVLEARQEPKEPGSDVVIQSRLFFVDLPGYVSHGTGGELQKFLVLLQHVAESQAAGRQPVATLPRERVDPLHEVVVSEGLLGGNCATELLLFYEDRAGIDESTAIRLLTHASEVRNIKATPIINDEAVLLYNTRMRNTLEGMRALCNDQGAGLPLAEFEKACAKVEVREERLKGQVALYADRCTSLQAELVASEQEKQTLVEALEALRQRELAMQAANLYSNQDIASRLNTFEKDLLKAKLEAHQAVVQATPKRTAGVQANITPPATPPDGGGGRGKLAKLEQDKHAIEKEFVALRVNYFHLVDEHKKAKQEVEALTLEVAGLRSKDKDDVAGQVRELRDIVERQRAAASGPHQQSILPPLTPPKEDARTERGRGSSAGGGHSMDLQKFIDGPHQLLLEEKEQLAAELAAAKEELRKATSSPARRSQADINTTQVNVAPGTDFKEFLDGPYKKLIAEKEEFQARALRAEAELADFEEMLEMKIEQFEEERAALEDEIAALKG